MDQMMKQSETLNTKPESYMAKRIVSVIFGIIEIILGFRFIFKLFGANPSNGFVKAIYNMTQWFVGIFEGIFSKATTGGAVVKAVFEPSTFIAIIIVALLAWIVLKLMTPRKSSTMERTEYTAMPVRPAGPTGQAGPTGPTGPTEVK